MARASRPASTHAQAKRVGEPTRPSHRLLGGLAGVSAALLVALDVSAAVAPPITQRSSGKTFKLAKGATATLRLSNRWRWSSPRVSTKAIELVPVEYFIDPGFREWTIEPRTRGRATIRSLGTPNCSSCGLAARRFEVTIVVGGG
jgi:hypothetical protein